MKKPETPPIRTDALISPETNTSAQHQAASVEKRRTPSSTPLELSARSQSSATNPPTQSEAAVMWTSRLTMATSCEPELAEWPTRVGGTKAANETASRPVVSAKVSTHLLASDTTSARTACTPSARPCGTCQT